MYKGLYLDDDFEKLNYISEILADIANIEISNDPRVALKNLKNNRYDFILIDIRMPQMNGLDFIKTISENDLVSNAKIFILSTMQDNETKIRGLSLGICDYLSFEMSDEEIKLRITNRMKNQVSAPTKELCYNNLFLNSFNSSLKFNSNEVCLTPLEYRIMLTLINFSGTIPDSSKLKEFVWTEEVVTRQTVNTHISNLKKKLAPAGIGLTRTADGGVLLNL